MNILSMKKSMSLLAGVGLLCGVCATASAAVQPMHVVVVENATNPVPVTTMRDDGVRRVMVVHHYRTNNNCYTARVRNLHGHYTHRMMCN